MSCRVRSWLPASLMALVPLSGVALANPPTPPCPTPKAPATRIIVEMSPPEITFKQAAPVSVRAPAAHSPPYQCYPFTFPPQAPAAYPAPPYQAPTLVPLMPPYPVASSAGFYPVSPLQTFAPPQPAFYAPPAPSFAPPCAPPAGFGPPACQSPGAGQSVANLEAALAAQRAFEDTDMKGRHAALQREYDDLSAKLAARGITPGAPPRSPGARSPAASPPAGDDASLREIQSMKEQIRVLQEIVVGQNEVLKKNKLIP